MLGRWLNDGGIYTSVEMPKWRGLKSTGFEAFFSLPAWKTYPDVESSLCVEAKHLGNLCAVNSGLVESMLFNSGVEPSAPRESFMEYQFQKIFEVITYVG